MKKIKYEGVDETVFYEKLENGLAVYMYPNDMAKNFYLTFNVKYGSLDTSFRFEDDKEIHNIPNGTAHFLEHQMFQEEKGHTAFEEFARLGSSVNAFTTYNLTCYECIASDHFKDNLELLLDFVQTPVFKSSSVSNERGIIKEEIKMYDNNPNAVVNYGLEYNLNINDNHKYTISGSEEDIKDITAEILQDAYDAFYQPENMFLVITGKFKPLEALGIIKENQKKKEFALYRKPIRIKNREPLRVERTYEERTMDVALPKIKMAYKISKKVFKDYSDLELRIYLDALLTIKFGVASDILESLTEANMINWDISTSRDLRDDYVLITFGIESEYIEEIISIMRENLISMKIKKEEIERIKRTNIANFILHFNDIVSTAEDIQDDIITNGSIITDIINIYKNLNVRDAQEIATRIDLANECIYIVKAEDE